MRTQRLGIEGQIAIFSVLLSTAKDAHSISRTCSKAANELHEQQTGLALDELAYDQGWVTIHGKGARSI